MPASNKLKVSICCITYNQATFLPDALKGFSIQKVDFPIEILIYDDCSQDTSRDLLREFKKTCPHPVTLLFPEENRFSKGERIFPKTFAKAQGKYLALCEGDDYWTDPFKLQSQVDFLEANKNYNICFHNVEIFNQETGELLEDTITGSVPETTTIKDLVKQNYIHTPSVVLRNNFTIPDWFKEVVIGDWSLYMLQIQDKKIKKFSKTMAVYRMRDGAMWSTQNTAVKKEGTRKTIQVLLDHGTFPQAIRNMMFYKLSAKNRKHTTKEKWVALLKLKLGPVYRYFWKKTSI